MISTKGRYALRIMLDLAQQSPDRYIPLDEIASRQEISKKYLEIIIKALVSNHLLVGLRGKGGGYRMTRQPSEYSVGEIIEAAEGPMAVVSCLQDGAVPCDRKDGCLTFPMWSKLDNMIHDFFYGIALTDLTENTLQ